jgi:hypothetical protein
MLTEVATDDDAFFNTLPSRVRGSTIHRPSAFGFNGASPSTSSSSSSILSSPSNSSGIATPSNAPTLSLPPKSRANRAQSDLGHIQEGVAPSGQGFLVEQTVPNRSSQSTSMSARTIVLNPSSPAKLSVVVQTNGDITLPPLPSENAPLPPVKTKSSVPRRQTLLTDMNDARPMDATGKSYECSTPTVSDIPKQSPFEQSPQHQPQHGASPSVAPLALPSSLTSSFRSNAQALVLSAPVAARPKGNSYTLSSSSTHPESAVSTEYPLYKLPVAPFRQLAVASEHPKPKGLIVQIVVPSSLFVLLPQALTGVDCTKRRMNGNRFQSDDDEDAPEPMEPPNVDVIPLLFTQGVNEMQSFANKLGLSDDQLQINLRNLRYLRVCLKISLFFFALAKKIGEAFVQSNDWGSIIELSRVIHFFEFLNFSRSLTLTIFARLPWLPKISWE